MRSIKIIIKFTSVIWKASKRNLHNVCHKVLKIGFVILKDVETHGGKIFFFPLQLCREDIFARHAGKGKNVPDGKRK